MVVPTVWVFCNCKIKFNVGMEIISVNELVLKRDVISLHRGIGIRATFFAHALQDIMNFTDAY